MLEGALAGFAPTPELPEIAEAQALLAPVGCPPLPAGGERERAMRWPADRLAGLDRPIA